jgi:hypothetical protein
MLFLLEGQADKPVKKKFSFRNRSALDRKYFYFKSFRRIAKKGYYLRHGCSSVRPHGTTLLSLDEFS